MAPSPSHRPSSPSPLSTELRSKRALEYWHKYGKFIMDEPGYDPVTCTVKKVNAQAHKRTSTPPPNPTTALTQSTVRERLHTERPSESDEGSDSTTERRPRWMNDLVTVQREEREALRITPKDYGTRWQSAYRDVIGPTPECGPGDHDKAQVYWYRILRALEEMEKWTPGERNRLYLLAKKWQKRAEGKDQRFEVVGNMRGTPDASQRRQIRDRKTLAEIAELAKGRRS